MNGFFAMMTVPPGHSFPEALHLKKMCAIVGATPGSMEEANTILNRFAAIVRRLSILRADAVSHAAGHVRRDYPTGLQWYWKADFFKELSDAAIEKHIDTGRLCRPQPTMHLYPVNGKVNRWAKPNGVQPSRPVWSEVTGVDPDPANRDKIINWARVTTMRASVRLRWRLSELHDGRRRGPDSRHTGGTTTGCRRQGSTTRRIFSA
jgi:hypothetical protein